jgi:hypothetical protein
MYLLDLYMLRNSIVDLIFKKANCFKEKIAELYQLLLYTVCLYCISIPDSFICAIKDKRLLLRAQLCILLVLSRILFFCSIFGHETLHIY